MTDAPEPNPSPEPEAGSTGPRMLKGCLYMVGLLAIFFGILVVGNFDKTAWASALTAVTVGVLVFGMSGVNGFWER